MWKASEHRAIDVELIDTWEPEDGPIACGCIAFHCEDGTLTIYSRSRYARPCFAASAKRLVAGWHDKDAWPLVRQRFREVAQSRCAVGPTVSQKATGQGLLGLHMSDCGGGVHLEWSSPGLPTHLAFAEDWDAAVFLGDQGLSAPSRFVLAASGPYAWLHPAARIPATLDGLHFPSAAPADWPLRAWQMLRSQGCNARLSEHVHSAKLPEEWAVLVARIMWARIQQHPWIRHRLPVVPTSCQAGDCLSEIALSALPFWRRQLDVESA